MSVTWASGRKIAQTSSQGNQEKWLEGGRWYKLDQFGYEGLVETLVSGLLERSGMEADTPFRFVRYRMERMHVHGFDRTGCRRGSCLGKRGKNRLGKRQDIKRLQKKSKCAIIPPPRQERETPLLSRIFRVAIPLMRQGRHWPPPAPPVRSSPPA